MRSPGLMTLFWIPSPGAAACDVYGPSLLMYQSDRSLYLTIPEKAGPVSSSTITYRSLAE